MPYKSFPIYMRSILGYLSIVFFFPLLLIQGIYLKKVVLRLSTPTDSPFGFLKGKKRKLQLLGIGESAMAGVGISKNSETLTGLTALRLNQSMDYQVNWKVMAESGLTINNLNLLLGEETSFEADLILVSIGGNDVFNLTAPWVWERNLIKCINILARGGKKPLILFSPVPCVGRFPAIPNPLRMVFGYWELLLQSSLSIVMYSLEDVYLLEERFPDGREFFIDDGIHPSELAYKLWSEKLASTAIEMIEESKLLKD